MTKVQNPIIGRAKQQAGGMVFSTVYGQNVMRAKPFEITYKKTPKRTKQIVKFKAGNELASKVKSYLHMIYPNSPLHFSKYNLLMRDCMSSLVFEDPAWVFNPINNVIGNGTLADVKGGWMVGEIENWILSFDFSQPYAAPLTDQVDFVYCFITDSLTKEIFVIKGTENPVQHKYEFTIPEALYDREVFISNPFVYRGESNNSTKLNFTPTPDTHTLVGNL